MNEDDKVISLDERRKGRPSKPETRTGKETSTEDGTRQEDTSPLAGQLIWLHCPTCGTYQYTEMAMEGGRQHNACGTMVEEVTVDIDVRAEVTLADFNLQRLNDLAGFLEAEREKFEEYRKRLYLVAGRNVQGYPLTEETLKKLPVAEINPLGLLVPKALAHPETRFSTNQPDPSTEE